MYLLSRNIKSPKLTSYFKQNEKLRQKIDKEKYIISLIYYVRKSLVKIMNNNFGASVRIIVSDYDFSNNQVNSSNDEPCIRNSHSTFYTKHSRKANALHIILILGLGSSCKISLKQIIGILWSKSDEYIKKQWWSIDYNF